MHKTGCSGKIHLSCTDLAHHELESTLIIMFCYNVIKITTMSMIDILPVHTPVCH